MKIFIFFTLMFSALSESSAQNVYYYLERASKNAKQSYNQDLLQEAILDCNKALAIEPQNVFAFIIRASAKESLEDYRGAILDYNKAIASDSKNATLYGGRGVCKRYLLNPLINWT